jgi:hypothetical protein
MLASLLFFLGEHAIGSRKSPLKTFGELPVDCIFEFHLIQISPLLMRPLEGKRLTSSLLIVIVDELKYHNDEFNSGDG